MPLTRPIHFYCFLFLLIGLPASGFSQPAATSAADSDIVSPTLFQYLSRDAVLPMTLKVDMRAMYRQKIRVLDYLSAQFTYRSTEVAETTWDIKLKARGNVRRRICAYPPLKLKFSKKLLQEANLIADHNKLKLVTHCKAGGAGSQLVLREYLAYRIYNQLTDNSFRAQLVEIDYEDARGKRKKITEYGILIEDVDELAERIGGRECGDCAFTNPARFEHEAYLLFCVYQYLIGNTDFSIKDLHNLKVVELSAAGSYLPVPYDFDYAGMVNAEYAVPHKSIPIDDVTERFYMGLRFPCASFEPILQRFQEERENIFALVRQLEPLDNRNREEVRRYLEEFYRTLDNPEVLRRAFDCVEEGRK